ncbi:glutathione S-transferase N-terminal domain-containing protein [Prosthecomicrobium hirschii]|uniref:glutathione S-transferase N-terminal domain-containing protein n=1 Tax=Prosthecodimorpha hirschii TaxID=665126 RepID=UPI00222068EA|nr:glutathione S-transferase N-terminal domain-containing protein [Prosthecomicrobium hirschii]MCW1844020.1 glutathione S-transferase N-terminal domain-containing protein [Prosthecomicrobium hirschii]
MITFYTWTTPNGRKISIALEEMGLAYEVKAVNIGKNEQFDPAYLKVAPNNRIPAIVDHDAEGGPLSLFESGAILIYLAEKTGRFLPASGAGRYHTLQWLMWQMGGVGPMFGQANHFIRYAPEKVPYGINRYVKETQRLLGVMDRQLAGNAYLAGADYSIADMATYAWTLNALTGLADQIADGLPPIDNVRRWVDQVGARPAVQRGMLVP